MPGTANRTRRPFERGEVLGPTNATAPETKGRQCFWGTSRKSAPRQGSLGQIRRVQSGEEHVGPKQNAPKIRAPSATSRIAAITHPSVFQPASSDTPKGVLPLQFASGDGVVIVSCMLRVTQANANENRGVVHEPLGSLAVATNALNDGLSRSQLLWADAAPSPPPGVIASVSALRGARWAGPRVRLHRGITREQSRRVASGHRQSLIVLFQAADFPDRVGFPRRRAYERDPLQSHWQIGGILAGLFSRAGRESAAG
jgi:hypothetical protein